MYFCLPEKSFAFLDQCKNNFLAYQFCQFSPPMPLSLAHLLLKICLAEEKTGHTSLVKTLRENTQHSSESSSQFLKTRTSLISLVNPAPLQHFISLNLSCFFPLYLFRRALWRRRSTHKARPHFLQLVRLELISIGKN